MIGLIVAESKEIADAAVRLIKIEYEDLPTILTIKVIFISSCMNLNFFAFIANDYGNIGCNQGEIVFP